MGEIVWMGRRRDNGEVEEIGRGASLQVPDGYERIWPEDPQGRHLPHIIAGGGDRATEAAALSNPIDCRAELPKLSAFTLADAYDGPRTVSELPEVVQGEQAIEATKPRRRFIEELPAPKCKNCNDSGYLINNAGEHRCFDCTAPFDTSRTPGRLPDEPIDPRHRVQPKPLTAAEVTEPGWYWYRGSERERWQVVHVHGEPGDMAVDLPGEDLPSLIAYFQIDGTFIGPLRAPEGYEPEEPN